MERASGKRGLDRGADAGDKCYHAIALSSGIRMVWEQRWHPLRREWVIVSSHRNERPWQGERVEQAQRQLPAYAPDCYLCPGNGRISGKRNPQYTGIFAFDNDHPCVSPDAPAATPAAGLYRSEPA